MFIWVRPETKNEKEHRSAQSKLGIESGWRTGVLCNGDPPSHLKLVPFHNRDEFKIQVYEDPEDTRKISLVSFQLEKQNV